MDPRQLGSSMQINHKPMGSSDPEAAGREILSLKLIDLLDLQERYSIGPQNSEQHADKLQT